MEPRQIFLLFKLLDKDEAAETFTEMNSDIQEMLINAMTDSEIKEVMDEMYLDDAVDVLEEMPANVVSRQRQKSNITLTPGTREKVEMNSSSTTAPSVDVIT
jgi:Mg/Co/Ni transporter MgtE